MTEMQEEGKVPYFLDDEMAHRVIENLRKLIKLYFEENGLTYAIFGKSEGLDSSVIAGLLSDIEGVRPIGVMMPCESDPEAERIAKLVLDEFRIPSIRVDLTREFHFLKGHYYSSETYGQLVEVLNAYGDGDLVKSLPHKKARASGNMKARLRMITLYHVAQLLGGLVVSTDNLSELWMGFWTLNGDVGDLAPIQHIFKGIEEYTIAKALGVPAESLDAAPTDGLDVIPGGVDKDQLGLHYDELDRVIIALLQNKFDGTEGCDDASIQSLSESLSEQLGLGSAEIAHVARQLRNTHYKRNWPRIFSRTEIGLPDINDIKI
jgi:nicotinamide-nucleotide amidase